MEKMLEYFIGGTVALIVFYQLAPTIIDYLTQAETAAEGTGVQAVLGLLFILFVIVGVWKFYESA